ncbi:MAG: hypothetical protein Q9188_007395 [Gyalolechia gomerana]
MFYGDSPWTAVVNSLIITAQRTQTRPEAIIRLPPPTPGVYDHQTHRSRARFSDHLAVTTDSYPSKWQKRFDDLLAHTDMKSSGPSVRHIGSRTSSDAATVEEIPLPASTVYAPKPTSTSCVQTLCELPAAASKDPIVSTVAHSLDNDVATASIIGGSDSSISEGGTSYDDPCIQEKDVGTTPQGQKRKRKRMRKKQSGSPKAKVRRKNDPKIPQPRLRFGSRSPLDRETVAILLRNALTVWENLCQTMLDGISANDRDTVKQISNLVSRLEGGSGPIDPRQNISPTGREEIPPLGVLSRCHGLDGMYDEDQPVPGSPQGSLDSFHTVSEGGLGGEADESPYPEQAVVKASLRGGEDEASTVLQEDAQERQARLERITSCLLVKRKEQPIEGISVARGGCPEASFADIAVSQFPESKSSQQTEESFQGAIAQGDISGISRKVV